jgi:hypothetical protein
VVGISRSTGGGNYQGQVVGISRSIGGGNYQGQVVGEIIKVKWWGYQGQLVGEIIKVKWWGYLGQVVGISRPSGGDIKVRGRGLEVKVKKKWWGVRALSNSLYSRTTLLFLILGIRDYNFFPRRDPLTRSVYRVEPL